MFSQLHMYMYIYITATHTKTRGGQCVFTVAYIYVYIYHRHSHQKPAHPGAGMLVFTHPKGCHSQHPCTRPHGRAPVRPSPFRAVPRTSLCNPPRLGTCLNRAHVTHGPLDNAACMQYGLGGICAFTCSQCDAMHSPPPPLFCMQPFTCSCVAHATCVAYTESPRDPRRERKGGGMRSHAHMVPRHLHHHPSLTTLWGLRVFTTVLPLARTPMVSCAPFTATMSRHSVYTRGHFLGPVSRTAAFARGGGCAPTHYPNAFTRST